MKVRVESESIRKAFDDAQASMWNNQHEKWRPISVKEQLQFWKEHFHATVSGGHFDHIESIESKEPYDHQNEWNTRDAVVEFDTEGDYVLFLLEWS